jgi:glycerol-3-phosphate acyltransferase PlsY
VSIFLLPLLAYLLGSIPFGVIAGYIIMGRDIRAGGSGHSGATNVIRQMGKTTGALVAFLDIAKGALAAWLAVQSGDGALTTALAAGAVVAGHCWPLFAGFRGGMGLAAAGGVMLVVYPLGFAAMLGLLITAAFVVKHSARAGFATALLSAPLLWLLSRSLDYTLTGAALGFVIAIRALSDWNRKQTAIWLAERKTEE